MRGILAAKYVQVARAQGQGLHRRIFAEQQPRNARIIRICVAAQIPAILELAALLRRLQQQRGGEFGAIEMPVQALALAVGEHVGAGQRIVHHVEALFLHHRGEKID